MNLDIWIAILSTTGFAAMITNAFSALAARGGKIKELNTRIKFLEKELRQKSLDYAEIMDAWDVYGREVEHYLWEIKRDFRDDNKEYVWSEFPKPPDRR